MASEEQKRDPPLEEHEDCHRFNSDPDPTAGGEYSLVWALIDETRRRDPSFSLLRYGKAPDPEIEKTMNAQIAEWNEYCRLSRIEDDNRQERIRTARQHAITPPPSPPSGVAVGEGVGVSLDGIPERATESVMEEMVEETPIVASAESVLQETRPEPLQIISPALVPQIPIATRHNYSGKTTKPRKVTRSQAGPSAAFHHSERRTTRSQAEPGTPFYQLNGRFQQIRTDDWIAGGNTNDRSVHRTKTGRIGKIELAKGLRSQAGNERSTVARRRMKQIQKPTSRIKR